MSVLRVQKITNEAGTGAVEFTTGATFPASQTFTATDLTINTSGIATVTNLVANDVNVSGIMSASNFVGNGFLIQNPPGTAIGIVIGQHLIT